jgi:hypothetical protein
MEYRRIAWPVPTPIAAPRPGTNHTVIAWIMPSSARAVSAATTRRILPPPRRARWCPRAFARPAAAGRCSVDDSRGTAPGSPRPSPRSCGGSPCTAPAIDQVPESARRIAAGLGQHLPHRSMTDEIDRSRRAVRIASLFGMVIEECRNGQLSAPCREPWCGESRRGRTGRARRT